MKVWLVFGILIAVHVFVATKAIKVVNRTNALTATEKKIQKVLILCIPFLWAAIIKSILKRVEGSHEPHPDIEPTRTYFDRGDIEG